MLEMSPLEYAIRHVSTLVYPSHLCNLSSSFALCEM
jgi:hypothetical protein